ncbi:MAG: nickel pincer cofactor biosynthesis protein LarC [Acidobacteria bacterium]|nr:nickel pincer cofactor biosynthesis protein LarC [Acidobacteriota bacterium]
MRTLYFDCFSGASGDMINGALIDLGVNVFRVKEELRKVPIGNYEISVAPTTRSNLRGTKFDVHIEGEDRQERTLSEIVALIQGSQLPESVRTMAVSIFQRLGEAEAKAHGVSLKEVHFHEVGAIDSIVDIVGACVGFHLLGIERFLSSALNVGRGMIGCSHGRMPVPVAATADLLRGARIYSTEVEAELVTPTGAAIISTVCEDYGPLPEMRFEKAGYGAGTWEFPDRPNMLRLMLGETEAGPGLRSSLGEKITLIEANIDDMSPEIFGYLVEQSLHSGALDIFYTPAQMKKNRPGTQLTILCQKEDRERLIELVFRETTTIGLRYHEVERRVLHRRIVEVQTALGSIRVKVSSLDDKIVNFAPEYADCKAAAERYKVPLREVMGLAVAAFERMIKG